MQSAIQEEASAELAAPCPLNSQELDEFGVFSWQECLILREQLEAGAPWERLEADAKVASSNLVTEGVRLFSTANRKKKDWDRLEKFLSEFVPKIVGAQFEDKNGNPLTANLFSIVMAAKDATEELLATVVVPASVRNTQGATVDVPSALKDQRREIVLTFRRKENLTMPDLARRVRMSKTAILGVINGDRSRYSEQTRDGFLKSIGASIEQWNGN